MNAGTRALRVLTLAPAVAVSTVLWLVAAALAPGAVGGLLMLTLPLALAFLWFGPTGCSHGWVGRAAALLAGARAPTTSELLILRPVITRLSDLEVETTELLVGRFTKPQHPVRPCGRDQVVVARALVEAVAYRQISTDQAAALILHNIGWLQAQPTRGAVAIAAWTAPWRAISASAAHVGVLARRMPLVELAWRIRFVVGAVAVVQSVQAGRTIPTILVASFLIASYATPVARRTLDARLHLAADDYVSHRGLGPTLMDALHLVGAPTPSAARTRCLMQRASSSAAVGLPATRPGLRLVQS